jgi:SAM-dependent methyltransferase
MTNVLSGLHAATVHQRRVRRLAALVSELMPTRAQVLDVGCGDGRLGALLMQMRPDVTLQGIDVLVRPQTLIPVRAFDGVSIPLQTKSVDVVLLVDVLHHCDAQIELLRECGRVARHAVTIKDHLADGWAAKTLLRFMDWVGNAGHGVALPYSYWRRSQWQSAFADLEWTVDSWRQNLSLYPLPADWLFGRDLHFLAHCLLPPLEAHQQRGMLRD